MVTPVGGGVNMQVEIKLLNNFHTHRATTVKGRTSKNLTAKQAEIMYYILNKVLDKVSEKEDNFWEKDLEDTNKIFKLELPQLNKTVDLMDDEEDWLVDWSPNGL